MTSVPDPMFLGDERAEVCIPNVGNAGGEPQEPPGHHRVVRLFLPQPVGLPTKTVLLHSTLSKIKQNSFIEPYIRNLFGLFAVHLNSSVQETVF